MIVRATVAFVRGCVALIAGLAGGLAVADRAFADTPPADPRETFGLDKKNKLATSTDKTDPRDLFGLGKKTDDDKPATCEDPHTFGCATSTDPLNDASPYGLSTWLPASYLERLPVAYATVDSVAHWALGAGRDEVGPFFGGATGLENRWTIDGSPIESIRSGGSDTRIPLTFIEGITVSAGGFTARDRASTGGTIDITLRRGTENHVVNAWVWGGLTGASHDRPRAPGVFYVREQSTELGPETSASVVGTGPIGALFGGTAWYAAGIAPTLGSTETTWLASRIRDENGDGVPDGFPNFEREPIAFDTVRTYDWLVPAMGRLGFERGPHAVELTLIGHASQGTRFLANSTIQAAGIDRRDYVVDGIATWRGKWTNTRALVQLAWHRSDRDETAHDPRAANLPQRLSAYVPMNIPEEPALASLCNDNISPTILQCAVLVGYFASGGAGQLVHSVGDRPTATAEIAHRDGKHVVRAGGTFEDARLVLQSRLTGGEQVRSLFEGHEDSMRFLSGTCDEMPFAPCNYVDVSELRYRTRYAAAYVEDTVELEEGLRADGGLRWELMWVGAALHFSNQLAPRGGVSWDFLGKGRSRLWASGGRTYAMMPTGLGPTILGRDAVVHDVTTGVGGHARDTNRGGVYGVAPETQPIAQDELTTGVEVGLANGFRLIAWVQGRWLRRGLETTPDGFANPGRTGINLPARRSAEILAIEIATEPTAQLTVRAGYAAGRTIGNFIGPWDPRQGATLYDGDEFNGAFATSNEMGRLPTDLGHRVYIEGARRGQIGPVELSFGTRLTLASARPRNVFAETDVGLITLVPRGSIERGPMLSQANLRLAARWRGFDMTLDVFNAFDRAEATNTDDLYTESLVRPIEGGTYEDLIFLKNTLDQPHSRRTAYGLPFAFQGPISAVLGVHRSF